MIFEQAAFRVLRCPVPVIAAVEGFALAGGCELAILSDFIVAGETAVFGVPETTLGIFRGIGGTQLLPRIVGAPLAKELIFTGRRMKADEAKAAGLVNHLVPAGQARARATEIAATIAEEAFEDLDAPVKRIAAPDTPVPFSPPLEKAFIPQVEDVVKGLRDLAEY